MQSGKYLYKTPNKVIREIYYDYYFTYLTEAIKINESMVADAIIAFEEKENIVPLIDIVERIINESTKNNNRYMIHFREHTLQTLFFLLLRKSNINNALMEYKIEKRYIDILYAPIQYGYGKQYAFEFKYISQAKYDEDNSILDKALEDVSEQIRANLRALDDAKGMAIVFVGKSCKYSKVIRSL